jgi:hypothetical protein
MTRTAAHDESVSLFLIQPREPSWWYWLASAILLWCWVGGLAEAAWLLGGLSLVQIAHFRLREGRLGAFPVQVRIAYAGIVALAAWDPTHLIVWIPTVGTTAQVVFGYCLLARTLSLLPWNRTQPLTASLVWRTYGAAPRRGSVLQGQPPLQPTAAAR